MNVASEFQLTVLNSHQMFDFKTISLTAISVTALAGCAWGSPTSQVKEDLRRYVDALNSANPAKRARPFVFGAKGDASDWEKYWKRERSTASRRSSSSPEGIEWNGVGNISIRGDRSQAQVRFFWFSLARQETLQLKRVRVAGRSVWQIVPGQSSTLAFAPTQPLEQAAFFLKQSTQARPVALAITEMRNLKSVTLNIYLDPPRTGNPLFSQKSVVAAQSKTGANQREIASLRVGGTRDLYRFNSNLEGKTLGEVSQPALTVLLYDGSARRLRLRYNGKGVVAFADGHTELLTQAQFATKIW